MCSEREYSNPAGLVPWEEGFSWGVAPKPPLFVYESWRIAIAEIAARSFPATPSIAQSYFAEQCILGGISKCEKSAIH
jgi:hypothetical protein